MECHCRQRPRTAETPPLYKKNSPATCNRSREPCIGRKPMYTSNVKTVTALEPKLQKRMHPRINYAKQEAGKTSVLASSPHSGPILSVRRRLEAHSEKDGGNPTRPPSPVLPAPVHWSCPFGLRHQEAEPPRPGPRSHISRLRDMSCIFLRPEIAVARLLAPASPRRRWSDGVGPTNGTVLCRALDMEWGVHQRALDGSLFRNESSVVVLRFR